MGDIGVDERIVSRWTGFGSGAKLNWFEIEVNGRHLKTQ